MDSIYSIINHLYNNAFQKIDCFLGTTFPKPTIISLWPTVRCNSKCKMCLSASKMYKYKAEMSTEQIKKLITELKKWLGPYTLSIGGGEPTLRKDLWEIIRFANNQQIRTILSTNGILITKEDIPKIINSGLKEIRISLDSLNPETYKKVRGVNAQKKVVQTIDLVKEHIKNIRILVNVVITKHNVDEIPDLVKFAGQKKLDSITINAVTLINLDIKKGLKHLWPNQKKVETAIDKAIEYKKNGYPVQNSVRHLKLIKEYYKNPRSIKEKCQAPLILFRIKTMGYAEMCIRSLGNVFNESPKEIWNSQRTKQIRKEMCKCRKSCVILTGYTEGWDQN